MFRSLSSPLVPDEKEKSKINSEELQIKKAKKKKKKKHKEGEKHKQVKMYHRSCQTVCAGLLLPPPSPFPTSSSLHNSSSSPFKSPLPVSPQSINRTPHLPHSSLPLLSKSIFTCLHPSPAKLQPQSPHPGTRGLEFGPYIHIERQPNGGALVAHAYASQLSSLSQAQRERFAREFVTLSFSEDSSQVPYTLRVPRIDS